MRRDLSKTVRERSRERCEYCLLPEFALPLPFQIDHIIAEKHGGRTVLSNLGLACPHCNRHKGPNIAGLDTEIDQVVPLFNPRTDNWEEHFEFSGARILGKTATGRVTVQVLAMNSPDLVLLRRELLKEKFRPN